jgi:hypothetical protein
MLERISISSGMLVRAADGSRLGRVYASDWDRIWIRPRFRKTPRFAVPVSAVKSLKRGDVVLRGGSELLQPLTEAETQAHPPLISVRAISQEEQASLQPQ